MSAPGGRRRRAMPVVATTLLAAGTGLVLWLVGLSPGFAVAFGVVAIAAGIAWSGLVDAEALGLPRPERHPQAGTRADIAQISWSMRPLRPGVVRFLPVDGPIHEQGVRRLRRFAARRLSAWGLDPADPADRPELERLLGAGPAWVITSAPTNQVTMTMAEGCLAALETLGQNATDRKGSPTR